jgi:prenyltransferase beta subunit
MGRRPQICIGDFDRRGGSRFTNSRRFVHLQIATWSIRGAHAISRVHVTEAPINCLAERHPLALGTRLLAATRLPFRFCVGKLTLPIEHVMHAIKNDGMRMKRRRFLQQIGAGSVVAVTLPVVAHANSAEASSSIELIRKKTLSYIDSMRLADGPFGRFRYSANATKPTLYSSTYAAMTRHLYNDLDSLSDQQRQEWIDYLQSHQGDDGLFRDPVIGRGQAIEHLSWHVNTALHCLGVNARKRLRWVDKYKDKKALQGWLDARRWGYKVDYTSNIVQNLCAALQYARDFQNDENAAEAVDQILDYLANRADPKTGLWGDGEFDLDTKIDRSRAIQAAYHFWLLWIYDGKMIPYPELAVDQTLKTQNKNGGYGCGVHNRKYPYLSSACEDIDSVDPLVRLMLAREYRRDDIAKSLERALPWVLTNQTESGGWVFKRGLDFKYGHSEMYAGEGVGGMFPTWFRTLCLAYLGKGLPDSFLGHYEWQFVKSPGSHFWRNLQED